MKTERVWLRTLWYIEHFGKRLTHDTFGMDIEEYAKLMIELQELGFIKGVSFLYADDTVNTYNIENIRITQSGVELLKTFNVEVQKNIMEVLYDNRFGKSLTEEKLGKALFVRLKDKKDSLDAYIRILKEKGYMKAEKVKVPAFKSTTNKNLNTPAYTYEEYSISLKGTEYVENDFQEKATETKQLRPQNIFHVSEGGIVNFGTIHNLEVNYIEELNKLIPEQSIRAEIEKCFEDMKAMVSEENISKGKLAATFKKIKDALVDKGLEKVSDKVIDVGWIYLLAQLTQLIK